MSIMLNSPLSSLILMSPKDSKSSSPSTPKPRDPLCSHGHSLPASVAESLIPLMPILPGLVNITDQGQRSRLYGNYKCL